MANLVRRLIRKIRFMISFFDRGPRGAIDELANQRHIWSAGKLLGRNNVREATSISESMPYLEICKILKTYSHTTDLPN